MFIGQFLVYIWIVSCGGGVVETHNIKCYRVSFTHLSSQCLNQYCHLINNGEKKKSPHEKLLMLILGCKTKITCFPPKQYIQ